MSWQRPQPGSKPVDMALAREELGRRIRAARERSGLTLEQVAEEMGTSWRVVQRWNSGANAPRPGTLNKLADVLGVDSEHFQEPTSEHAIDRIDRRVEDNARTLRTALGLLDELLVEVKANRQSMLEIVNARSTEITGRLDELEARQDTADAQLTRVQADFLQALGAPVPQPATNAGEQATNTGSTTNADARPATGQ